MQLFTDTYLYCGLGRRGRLAEVAETWPQDLHTYMVKHLDCPSQRAVKIVRRAITRFQKKGGSASPAEAESPQPWKNLRHIKASFTKPFLILDLINDEAVFFAPHSVLWQATEFIFGLGQPPEAVETALRKHHKVLAVPVGKLLEVQALFLEFKSDVGLAFLENPWVFTNSLKAQQEQLQYLLGLGLSKDSISAVLRRHSHFLNDGLAALKERVSILEEYGVDALAVIQRLPEVLSCDAKALRGHMVHFESVWGFSREETATLVMKWHRALVLPIKNLEMKFQFLTETIGFDPLEIIKFSRLMDLSLINRVGPRAAFLMGRYPPETIPWSKYLCLNNQHFMAACDPGNEYPEFMKAWIANEGASFRLDALKRAPRRRGDGKFRNAKA